MVKRCWNVEDELYLHYHDYVWGKRVDDDKTLFEYLTLEGAQAGLSWITILKRQQEYKVAFDNFDYQKIALYDEDKVNDLLTNYNIIKNKRKVLATINNAKCYLEVIKEYGSFAKYLWGYVNNEPIINHYTDYTQVPVTDDLALKISKDLTKRGFKFVGPTIIYSYLQAVGVINDHLEGCDFKY
jgi:DNA-3-methyladenine glycosylase I